MLDRARPVNRYEDLNGTIALQSARDGSPFPAEEASFTYAIHRVDDGCCSGVGRAEVQIATGTDNLIATDNVLAFAFPPGTLSRLGPGRYVLILVCTLDGATSEMQRAPLTVI